ncbi:MAG TPA: hypothetical protein VKV03_19435 [Candidatus Binataceae bacterium]|nr:hypothetical protein [Candidatus Binataceae bacterium]
MDASGKIYVLNSGTSAVTVYPPLGSSAGISNETPVAVIGSPKTLLRDPVAIAVDGVGDIYVANQRGGPKRPVKDYSPGVITIYSAGSNGNVGPAATIKGSATGLTYPISIALDAAGDIYVGNTSRYIDRQVNYAASIEMFSAGSSGNAMPSAVIVGSQTNIGYPHGIAVDSHQNIYETGFRLSQGSEFSTINVYPAGSTGNIAPSIVFDAPGPGLSPENAIALDANGNLCVSNIGGGPAGSGIVTVYAAGSIGEVAPINTITSSSTGIKNSQAIAVGAGGRIYVANQFANSVGIYAAGSYATGPPIATITGDDTGLNSPFSIGLDANDDVFVLNNDDTVTVYGAGEVGDAPPMKTISIDASGNDAPTAIAVSPAGALYVANQGVITCNGETCHESGPGSIDIFSARSSGNAKPSAIINGPDTDLAYPSAIAVSNRGNVYVTNLGPPICGECGCIPATQGSVSVYASGSEGDSKPVATIEGPHTRLGLPGAIAVDANENVHVLNNVFRGYDVFSTSRIGFGCFGDFSFASGAPVEVFGAGSNGDTAPIAIIDGPFTAINGTSIAIALGR